MSADFESDAYDLNDPKHPGWADRVIDAADERGGDR